MRSAAVLAVFCSLLSVGLGLGASLDLDQTTLFGRAVQIAREHRLVTDRVITRITGLLPKEQAETYRQRLVAALDEPTDGSYCNICKVVIDLIRLAIQAQGYDEVEQTVIEACELLGTAIDQNIQVKTICPGTIKLQGPHVNAVLGVALTPTTLCEFLNTCYSSSPINAGWPPVSSTTASTGNRPRRQRATRPAGRPARKSGKAGSFTIAQLTDVHLEPDYAQGSATDCGLYVCCQAPYGPGPAGHFGDYNCNIPRRTMELFLRKIRDMNPNLVLFSGDVPPHTVWEETLQSQLDCTTTLVQSMQSIFGTGIRVLPSIGNHEMFPTNLFSVNQLPTLTLPLLYTFADLWRQLARFGDTEQATMRQGGYYVTQVAPGLRLISLSTCYMYSGNWYNAMNNQLPFADEATQMKKEVEEYLRAASCEGQKVIVMGHHVVGNSDYVVSLAKWYEQLMVDYSDIIVLQVAGHTHTDEFRLLSDSSLNVKSMLYVNPSVDIHGYRNPSVRLYELDADTFELLDYTQYYFDLSQLDPGNSFDPTVVELYSAKAEYGLPDLSPASWMDLLNRFTTDNDLLVRHIRHANADASRSGNFSCDAQCALQHLCLMRYASYDRYQACIHQYDPEPTQPTSPSTISLPTLTYPFLPTTPAPSTVSTTPPTTATPTLATDSSNTAASTTTAGRDRCYGGTTPGGRGLNKKP